MKRCRRVGRLSPQGKIDLSVVAANYSLRLSGHIVSWAGRLRKPRSLRSVLLDVEESDQRFDHVPRITGLSQFIEPVTQLVEESGKCAQSIAIWLDIDSRARGRNVTQKIRVSRPRGEVRGSHY